MGLLDDPFALVATASLVIQVVVLFLLVYGYSLKRRLKFRQHGLTMATAVVLHLIMIFVIMIPSFVLAVVPKFIVLHPFELTSIVGLIHGITGALAATLGVWLVAAWHFKEVKGCFPRKKYMRGTYVIWVTALVFGISLYIILYGNILLS